MSKIQSVRGTYDLYGTAKRKMKKVTEVASSVVEKYGFEEIETPIFEFTEVFSRNLGDTSDIVTKEMYCFNDKGGESLTLRPEGTAGVVRAFVSNGMQQNLPVKFYYAGPMFRYERPQKGRLRSFYQFNVDIVGEESYAAEAELIALAIRSFQNFGLNREHFYIRLSDRQLWTLWLQAFGINDESLKTKMLALFDKWERRSHEDIEKDLSKILPESVKAETFFQATEKLRQADNLDAIRSYFESYTLSNDLKISLSERLNDFSQLLNELLFLGCQEYIKIDLSIVRGLAYYTGFVFEVFETGNQGRALAGGGRYDQLFEKLTGHAMPAVGFAAGDVTLTDLLQKNNLLPKIDNQLDCYVVFEETEKQIALNTAQDLRLKDFSIKYTFGAAKSLSKQLKKAFSENPKFILIFGHNEALQNKVQIKDLSKDTTELVDFSNISDYLNH